MKSDKLSLQFMISSKLEQIDKLNRVLVLMKEEEIKERKNFSKKFIFLIM